MLSPKNLCYTRLSTTVSVQMTQIYICNVLLLLFLIVKLGIFNFEDYTTLQCHTSCVFSKKLKNLLNFSHKRVNYGKITYDVTKEKQNQMKSMLLYVTHFKFEHDVALHCEVILLSIKYLKAIRLNITFFSNVPSLICSW